RRNQTNNHRFQSRSTRSDGTHQQIARRSGRRHQTERIRTYFGRHFCCRLKKIKTDDGSKSSVFLFRVRLFPPQTFLPDALHVNLAFLYDLTLLQHFFDTHGAVSHISAENDEGEDDINEPWNIKQHENRSPLSFNEII